MDSVKYSGMDVHKETISIAIRNSSGKLVMECIIETKASTILQFWLRPLWWLILRRRSQRPAPWDRLLPIYTRWLPAPRVLHPYPTVRFLATHPRWEPYA